MPFAILQWMSGASYKVALFLPIHAEFWYLPTESVELGLAARVGGDQYHGEPARYLVENPQMRYSVVTVGPSVKLRLSKGFRLTADAGMTLLRRFEFFDGDDEAASYNLKNGPFVKAGIQFGG